MSGKWPCGVCGKEVQANSVQCTVCKKMIHKRCSGVRGDLSRVADGFRCRRCDGTIQEVDLAEDLMVEAPNDTAYKRWSCHSGFKLLCKLCRTSPPPAMGARFTVFLACRPCGPAGWLALLLTKVGDVETNPGPTTLNKKVWICDICHK